MIGKNKVFGCLENLERQQPVAERGAGLSTVPHFKLFKSAPAFPAPVDGSGATSTRTSPTSLPDTASSVPESDVRSHCGGTTRAEFSRPSSATSLAPGSSPVPCKCPFHLPALTVIGVLLAAALRKHVAPHAHTRWIHMRTLDPAMVWPLQQHYAINPLVMDALGTRRQLIEWYPGQLFLMAQAFSLEYISGEALPSPTPLSPTSPLFPPAEQAPLLPPSPSPAPPIPLKKPSCFCCCRRATAPVGVLAGGAAAEALLHPVPTNTARIGLILVDGTLISFQDGVSPMFTDGVDQLARPSSAIRSHSPGSAPVLMSALLKSLMERTTPILDHYSGAIMEFEDAILSPDTKRRTLYSEAVIQALHAVHHQLDLLRGVVAPFRDCVQTALDLITNPPPTLFAPRPQPQPQQIGGTITSPALSTHPHPIHPAAPTSPHPGGSHHITPGPLLVSVPTSPRCPTPSVPQPAESTGPREAPTPATSTAPAVSTTTVPALPPPDEEPNRGVYIPPSLGHTLSPCASAPGPIDRQLVSSGAPKDEAGAEGPSRDKTPSHGHHWDALRGGLAGPRAADITIATQPGGAMAIQPEGPLEVTRFQLRRLVTDCDRFAQDVQQCADVCSHVTDLVLNLFSCRMNAVMQTLTIISSIFVPLSFFAGVYGMNFDTLPELHWDWAYLVWWLFVLAVVALMLLTFKRKRWL
ncbi:putative magnesium and cobalt transport protein CorA [Paratrimastix pyriformis]|uniref:Magnesium and cobalt transport protein CorA n=1 Tax=Paratrimastix pyriformis TaxID=342808 RepID=A0ABQ8UP98_9EUKA|nr:putative magnesium and cobalt transport protein CorA [Paratrimastix pyriformis]